MHRELIIHLEDLRYAAIECPHCHTRVILDLKERSAVAEKYNWFTPKACPGCQVDYDSELRRNLDRLQNLYGPLLAFAQALTFRSPQAPDAAE